MRIKKDPIDMSSPEAAKNEIRFTVDAYYIVQEHRKAIANQVSALAKSGEPNQWISQFLKDYEALERQCANRLKQFSEAFLIGQWASSICGIGPVIAAGLIAHIDLKRAHHVSAVWKFAGLDPTSKWEKGEKRPFNAALKTLCWKIGESFVKVSGRDDDIYGKIYLSRKLREIERNDSHDFADQAKAKLERFKIGKTTDAYKAYSQGKLPPAHIHARAKRYAVKLFLSHWWTVAYEIEYSTKPPVPWILTQGAHSDYVPPPNWPMQSVPVDTPDSPTVAITDHRSL